MKYLACALLLSLACTRKPARPVLSVFEDTSPRSAEATAIDPRALALALGAMRPEAREQLRRTAQRVGATATSQGVISFSSGSFTMTAWPTTLP